MTMHTTPLTAQELRDMQYYLSLGRIPACSVEQHERWFYFLFVLCDLARLDVPDSVRHDLLNRRGLLNDYQKLAATDDQRAQLIDLLLNLMEA